MNTDTPPIDRIIQSRFISHILFWISFLLVFTLLASLNSGSFKMHIVNYLSMLPSQIAAAYLLNYYQLPKLLLKRKYLIFAVSIVFSVYMFSAMARISIVYIAEPFIRTDFEQESIQEILSDSAYLFSIYFPAVYIYAFIMLIVKAIKNRFEEKHQIEILEKEKVINELKFLKTQIQPHFLFNTLNNLYALTLAKSDVAPKIVLKLSELLDFILYQSNEPTIPIHKEVALIQGFIDLESLRYGNKLDLIFNNNVDDANVQVAPLILLPLIENAFKHGSGGNLSVVKIQVDLTVKNEALNFEICNSKLISSAKNNNHKSGIGTTNLKRQLALSYPDKHQLLVEDSLDNYLVKLYIDLK